MIEQDIENKVIKWAEGKGLLPIKMNLVGNTGWPDRLYLFAYPAVAFIEFKKPGEGLRRNQPARILELRKRGYPTGVFDNADDAIRFLEAACISVRGPKARSVAGLLGSSNGPRFGKNQRGLYVDQDFEDEGVYKKNFGNLPPEASVPSVAASEGQIPRFLTL